jgi:hypothetical protein
MPIRYSEGQILSNKSTVPFPKALWQHPLIGMGAFAESDDKNVMHLSPFEVWTEIGFAEFTTILIPGNDDALLTYDLADTGTWTWAGVTRPRTTVSQDISLMFNWTPRFTKRWLEALVEESLMTRTLADRIASRIRKRRPPGLGRTPRDAIPSADRRDVLAKTSGKCVYCAVTLTTEAGLPHSYHADHVLPVTRGGSNDIANLVPACATCNSSKRAKTLLMIATEKGIDDASF